MTFEPLALDDAFLVVMTGAGVSAESGVPTFRDANGLWEQHPVEEVASPEGFARDPLLVWRFYSQRRAKRLSCEPNPGHHAIADVERLLGDRFLLLTQNVDGLHGRAGSKRMVELHGNLFTTRCSNPHCETAPFSDERCWVTEETPDPPEAGRKNATPGRKNATSELPRCDRCRSLLRPHIVWFGESLDPRSCDVYASFLNRASSSPCKLIYLACGTSGLVQPAAGLVHAARRAGAHTVLVNLERPENIAHFDRVELGRSGEILPRLFTRA